MYIVEIKDGRKQTYYSRDELYDMGFRFKKRARCGYSKLLIQDNLMY